MKKLKRGSALRILTALLFGTSLASCAFLYSEEEEREEIVAGMLMPIPRGMNKSTERRVELSLPGLEGGAVTYHGYVDAKDIITYYQIELPRRGWTPKGSLVSQGGALAFTKENRSALIRVAPSGRTSVLDIVVGTVPLQSSSPFQEKSAEFPK